MPKRTDIKKVLVIGSGPIVIGQAAEFDYAGTQACIALREEGYEVILCNSNPATIMTDPVMADKVYMEPLTLEYLARIIRHERPDAIVPGIGGQIGLNLAMQLDKKGILRECQTQLLGTTRESIEKAEDRELFKELCQSIGEPVCPSVIVTDEEEGAKAAEEIGYPVVLRPAFTLGGTGGGFVNTPEQLGDMLRRALDLSPVHQVLIEKSVKGYKEIEYEVIRDHNDTAITICNMENLDPVGIHTGDSIVVCPSQTLTNKEYHMLRNSALKIIRALKIEGGCNVQFALDPVSFHYYVIEVNPRVSRSSALASKASGYPIARVSAKIAIGMTLDEIMLANTPAAFEPALDYVVTKMPRFPFDKFYDADHRLGTQMKATGEVMSIGRTFEESFLKAVRSLEIGVKGPIMHKFDGMLEEQLLSYAERGTDDRIFAIMQLLRLHGESGELTVEKIEDIHTSTGIDVWFIHKLWNIVREEIALRAYVGDIRWLADAKKMGFSDVEIGRLWKMREREVFDLRAAHDIFPVYKMIDSCASEFKSYIPYFYSCYEDENEADTEGRLAADFAGVDGDVSKQKIIVLGSGPIRIGQGVEFDYSTVHAVMTLRKEGYEAIVINNNPETVSTDYTIADKLYFEPLCIEDVMNIIHQEKPLGVIASLGGQTAINLAEPLTSHGVHLIGTDCAAIDRAEDRELFEQLLVQQDIPKPAGSAVTNLADGIKVAEEIGYPVLVRPSFVLGGRAMRIVENQAALEQYLQYAVALNEEHPVLVDHYVRGKEVEVDAVCDGIDVFVPGIMELVERTGVHSGDSISVYPPFTLSDKVKEKVLAYTKKLGLAIGIRGLLNIQFIVDSKEDVYIIEVNPRSSRTVPFLSKSTGYSLADIATKVMLGQSLKEQGLPDGCAAQKERWYVKAPAFSFAKLEGMDTRLSPEMKSTGEAIGYDDHLMRAFYKALQASGFKMKSYGTIFAWIEEQEMEEMLPLVRRFYDLGFNIEAEKRTALKLKEAGIRTRAYELAPAPGGTGQDPTNVLSGKGQALAKVLENIRGGYITYVLNTGDIRSITKADDPEVVLRTAATVNNINVLTSADTVRVLLDALEDITFKVSVITD